MRPLPFRRRVRILVEDGRPARRDVEGWGSMSVPKPPLARRAPERRERFGIVWPDEYAWLRDPAYPDVKEPEIRAYVEAEMPITRPSWRRTATSWSACTPS